MHVSPSDLVCLCLQALRQLQRQLADLSLPYQPDEQVQQWFLRDRNFDVEEAAEKLSKMCRWRHSFRPDLIRAEDIPAEIAADKAILHPHADIYGRPVVVVQARRHIVSETHAARSVAACQATVVPCSRTKACTQDCHFRMKQQMCKLGCEVC